MKFSDHYIATIVLLASSLAACYCEFTPLDYMVVPTYPTKNKLEFDSICSKIEDGGEKSPEEVKTFLKNAESVAQKVSRGEMDKSEDTTGIFKGNPKVDATRMWETLNLLVAEVSDPSDEKKCRMQAGSLLAFLAASTDGVSALEQTLASGSVPQNHRNLFNYLKHYGTEKYMGCLALFKSDIEDRDYNLQSQIFIASESDLDYVLTLGESTHMSHEQILPLIKDIDLANGKYQAKKMQKAMKDLDRYPKDSSGSETKDFFRFLDETCTNFQKGGLTSTFDVYNLGRLLLPADQLRARPSARWLKLNEYVRICSEFSSTKFRGTMMDNIRENRSNKIMGKLFGKH